MRWAIWATFAFFFATSATAQPVTDSPYRNLDSNRVDVVTGNFDPAIAEGHIGPDGGGLTLIRFEGRGGYRDNWAGDLRQTVENGVPAIRLKLGDIDERFTKQGSVWTSTRAMGATLVEVTAGVEWQFRAADGTRIIFRTPAQQLPEFLPGATLGSMENPRIANPTMYCTSDNAVACGVPVRIERPSGDDVTLTWHVVRQCSTDPNGSPGGGAIITIDGEDGGEVCTLTYRQSAVSSASGFAIKFAYGTDGPGGGTPTAQGFLPGGWWQRTSAKFLDLSQVYCDLSANNCNNVAGVWPTATAQYLPGGVTNLVNSVAGTTRVTRGTGGITGIRRPGAANDNITLGYDAYNRVTAITRDGVTTNYSWSAPAGNTQVVIADAGAGGGNSTVVTNPNVGRPTNITDALGNVTAFQYDANGRIIRETAPEGNYTLYVRDARGNVTETRSVAKPGSGIADIVSSASFPANCTNMLTCNQPDYVIDPRGNRTDYIYDPVHGGVTRVTLPSPSNGAPRPEVHYSYTPMQAQIRDASGQLIAQGDVQYRLTGISSCASAATCVGSANETRVTIAYNNTNLLPTSVTTAAGDGSINSTVSYAYDNMRNLISIDGALPGSDDTSTYIYDNLNRRRGTIGPDPDGAGARLRVGERYSFDADSRVIKVERGTLTAASAAALDAMVVAQVADISYDANGRVVRQTASANGQPISLVQNSYDAQGRLLCTALRMNPAAYASLPADACAQSTNGNDGPDRISRNVYDAADRLISTESGVGTADVVTGQTNGYTANGQIAWVQDGAGNRTTYVYDGHDRLSQTRYPVANVGAQASNAADYEQLSYDAMGNVIQRRLRDGQTIGYAYDALARLIGRDMPGGEPDASYTYDLAGRVVQMAQAGRTLSFTYDALGRRLSEGSSLGMVASQYDVAGRRTRLTYGDGFFVSYAYDILGNVTSIGENGATSGAGVLAGYAYDNLGRRASVTFGNGVVQNYGYDGSSALASLVDDLPGAAHDQQLSFTYSASGQMREEVRSNDAYAWRDHYNIDRLYTLNGLNRILTAGQLGIGYDGRGNLTSSGGSSFTYDADNHLVSAPGAVLSYDPAGRLYQTAGATTTRFGYDGINLIAEYDANNAMVRRYVHGPGSDEPIVWYEGSGTNDRRYMLRDARGSITSITNASGGVIAINSYDEYGIPAASNIGRFGYTGQTWLPEVGMWYYKARMYSATLGRFMQTDPIGYGDGLNFYAYVGNDPINFVDPLGLRELCWNDDNTYVDEATGDIVVRSIHKCADIPDFGSNGIEGGGGFGGGGGGGDGAGFPPRLPPPPQQRDNCNRLNNWLNASNARTRRQQALAAQGRTGAEYGFAVGRLADGRIVVSGLVTSGQSGRINSTARYQAFGQLAGATILGFVHTHPDNETEGLSSPDNAQPQIDFNSGATRDLTNNVAIYTNGNTYCTGYVL